MQQPHQPPPRFDDRAAFLAWAEQQPGKWERVYGVVYAISPERLDHSRVKANVYTALAAAIRSAGLPCEAFVDGPLVKSGRAHDFIPDVVVDCGERGVGKSLSVDQPVIVVEVSSPSTSAREASAKLGGYFAVLSVQHYLIISPDEHLVVHHSRVDDGKLLTQLHRKGAEITLAPPGLGVRLAEFYVGTDLAQQPE